MKAYKLYRIKKGKLFPLYIGTEEEMPMGVWIGAKAPAKTERGKVMSKLGELAYRPGFHSCALPLADHIGKKVMVDGKVELHQKPDTVWCEVELSDMDYTPQAMQQGKHPRDWCFREVTHGGYYRYKTRADAKVDWFISGEIKVNRILSGEEVDRLCMEAGLKPQPRVAAPAKPKKKYTVRVVTTFRKDVEIEAESVDDAITLAFEGIEDGAIDGIDTDDFDTQVEVDMEDEEE